MAGTVQAVLTTVSQECFVKGPQDVLVARHTDRRLAARPVAGVHGSCTGDAAYEAFGNALAT